MVSDAPVLGKLKLNQERSEEDHQSVLADDEQALGPVNLSQADFLIEGAVASQHHGDAVGEASLRDLGGRAQDRRGQVVDLKTRLQTKRISRVRRRRPGWTGGATRDSLPCGGPEAAAPTAS